MYCNRVLKEFCCRYTALSGCSSAISNLNHLTKRSFSMMNKLKTVTLCSRNACEKGAVIPQKVLTTTGSTVKEFSQVPSNDDELGKLLYVGKDGMKLRS